MRILFELGKGGSLRISYCSLNAESQALGTFTALPIIWTTLSSNLANFRECLTRQVKSMPQILKILYMKKVIKFVMKKCC